MQQAINIKAIMILHLGEVQLAFCDQIVMQTGLRMECNILSFCNYPSVAFYPSDSYHQGNGKNDFYKNDL